MELSDKARLARNAYQRTWRRKHPEKLRQYNADYWERKADPIVAKVRKLSKEGLTQRQIAEKLNSPLGAVNAYMNTK